MPNMTEYSDKVTCQKCAQTQWEPLYEDKTAWRCKYCGTINETKEGESKVHLLQETAFFGKDRGAI